MQAHKDLLGADLLLTCDGPVHPSGRPLIFFGARGDVGLDVTVYGPVRALHSGHYGNWAPNPAMELSRLLASMMDANGRVTIPGYYDDVVPLSALEKEWLGKMPDNDAELASEPGNCEAGWRREEISRVAAAAVAECSRIEQRLRRDARAECCAGQGGGVDRCAAGEGRGSAEEKRADCRVHSSAGIFCCGSRADDG